jgi:hypothetical protein
MKTVAQQIKWNFKANGNLEIKDKNGRVIYSELSNGVWAKWEFDSQGRQIYYENSNGAWVKYEYDSKGNQIYRETSDGLITDNRPKPCENKEIVIEGEKYKLVKV